MRPWQPPGLGELTAPESVGRLSYIVVEELSEGVASLVVSPWPGVDDRGRLRFGDEDEQFRVVANRDKLSDALGASRLPIAGAPVSAALEQQLRERPLSVGDVFGARIRSLPEEDGAAIEDPVDWLAGPVFDVSADARDAAKAQANAAVAGVLKQKDLERLLAEFREEEDEPPEPQDPTDPAGGGAPGGGAPAGGLPGHLAPEEADEPRRRLVAWRPDGLSPDLLPAEHWDALWYLVVDEIQEQVAVLVVSPWPALDDRGRLRFAREEDQVRVALTVGALRDFLSEQRIPVVQVMEGEEAERALRERPLAVGDAFAADLAFVPDEDGLDIKDPSGWIVGPVLDISAEMREAAKAQTSAAAAGPLTEDEVESIEAEHAEEDESPPERAGGV